MLFGKKKKPEKKEYDRTRLVPAIRKSICTGEEAAGFRHIGSDKFEDVMLIRGEEDLREFMEMYGITEKPEVFY